jgi:hypothetical protein
VDDSHCSISADFYDGFCKGLRRFLRQIVTKKGRKLPGEPADLELYDCVMLNARNNETDWDLVNGRKKARIHVSGPISDVTSFRLS